MIISFTQHTVHIKYCYQRSHVNSCSEGYRLALLHFLQCCFFKKKKKPHHHQNHSHSDDPVITPPQHNCNSQKKDAVDQGVSTVGGNLGGQELLNIIFSTCENVIFNFPINLLVSSVFHIWGISITSSPKQCLPN